MKALSLQPELQPRPVLEQNHARGRRDADSPRRELRSENRWSLRSEPISCWLDTLCPLALFRLRTPRADEDRHVRLEIRETAFVAAPFADAGWADPGDLRAPCWEVGGRADLYANGFPIERRLFGALFKALFDLVEVHAPDGTTRVVRSGLAYKRSYARRQGGGR